MLLSFAANHILMIFVVGDSNFSMALVLLEKKEMIVPYSFLACLYTAFITQTKMVSVGKVHAINY